MLKNKERVLIMGIHTQLGRSPIEETTSLKEIITQIRKDPRNKHIVIYGDLNLDFSPAGKNPRTSG